jgi:hypothetical protein
MPLSWIGPVARRPAPGILFRTVSVRLTALVKAYALVFLLRDRLKGRMM